MGLSVCLFYWWGNWVPGKFTDLSKVLQPVRGRAVISPGTLQSPHSCIGSSVFHPHVKMRKQWGLWGFIWEELGHNNLIGRRVGQGTCEVGFAEWAQFVSFLERSPYPSSCSNPKSPHWECTDRDLVMRGTASTTHISAGPLVCTELANYNQVSQKSFLVGPHTLICGRRWLKIEGTLQVLDDGKCRFQSGFSH